MKTTYTWHVVVGAGPVRQEAIPDLPSEDGGTLAFVFRNPANHIRGGHAGLRAPDRAGLNGAGLVVPDEHDRGIIGCFDVLTY